MSNNYAGNETTSKDITDLMCRVNGLFELYNNSFAEIIFDEGEGYIGIGITENYTYISTRDFGGTCYIYKYDNNANRLAKWVYTKSDFSSFDASETFTYFDKVFVDKHNLVIWIIFHGFTGSYATTIYMARINTNTGAVIDDYVVLDGFYTGLSLTLQIIGSGNIALVGYTDYTIPDRPIPIKKITISGGSIYVQNFIENSVGDIIYFLHNIDSSENFVLRKYDDEMSILTDITYNLSLEFVREIEIPNTYNPQTVYHTLGGGHWYPYAISNDYITSDYFYGVYDEENNFSWAINAPESFDGLSYIFGANTTRIILYHSNSEKFYLVGNHCGKLTEWFLYNADPALKRSIGYTPGDNDLAENVSDGVYTLPEAGYCTNLIEDLRDAIEQLVSWGYWKNPSTGNAYNWTDSDPDNAYHCAMASCYADYGLSSAGYDWTRSIEDLLNQPIVDLEPGEIDAILTLLENADV